MGWSMSFDVSQAKDFGQWLVDLPGQHSGLAVIFVVGIAALLVSCLLAWRRSSNDHWSVLASIMALFFVGLGFVTASSGLIGQRERTPPVPHVVRYAPQQAFENLKRNRTVEYLVRLVAYDPETQPFLRVGKLETLGAEQQSFVFVADYDELRGCTVAEALYRTGHPAMANYQVSGIIFPLLHRSLFPASARGVLQVIQDIDAERKTDAGYKPANLAKYLEPNEIAALTGRDKPDYRWDSYRGYHRGYSKAIEKLREEKCSAFDYMGTIERDWNSIGCAEVIGRDDVAPSSFELDAGDGLPTLKIANFGARVFLIRNMRIDELKGQVLFHSRNPEQDRIPDLFPVDPNAPALPAGAIASQ